MAQVITNKRHKQQQTSSSSSSSNYSSSCIPEDIIFQSVSLLPLKDVTRCMSVCKSWYALLNDPCFLNSYIGHHRIIVSSKSYSPRFLCVEIEGMEPHINVENLQLPTEIGHAIAILKCSPRYECIEIVGSCNGMLLCKVGDGEDLYLWNPTTRACMKLPESEEDHPKNFYLSYGLGFDSSNNDYKVVRSYVRSRQGISFQLYSCRTDSWKTILDVCPYSHFDETGMFANGFLHWLADDDTGNPIILSLNLIEEKFSSVRMPNKDGRHAHILGSIGTLEGQLYIVIKDSWKNLKNVWSIWVLKEVGVKESWTRLMEIRPSVRTDTMKPLCITKNGEVIMHITEQKIVKYDPKNEKFQTLFEFDYPFDTVAIREDLGCPMASF